ncbi:hypothetical protein ID866_2094 [Astraeus odoratus]|nr:hypothetical protein ID866_2094 [Astraeus odoratus]
MSSTAKGTDIFDVNPYEGHAGLSAIESEVLWEYAKLAHHIKCVTDGEDQRAQRATRSEISYTFACSGKEDGPRIDAGKQNLAHVSVEPDPVLQFKASVWGVINEQPTMEVSERYVE